MRREGGRERERERSRCQFFGFGVWGSESQGWGLTGRKKATNRRFVGAFAGELVRNSLASFTYNGVHIGAQHEALT